MPQLIGVLMAAACMNYLFLTHASAHNYCPVQLIITTQKCNSNVLYLYIIMSYEYMVISHGGSLVRLRSGPTRRASGPDTVRIADSRDTPRRICCVGYLRSYVITLR